jgi:3-oxoacyl-[acyl-carrier protein] reductase
MTNSTSQKEDQLTGKWALVGGASQGIGSAIAQIFAENGARVVLMSRSPDKLEALRRSLPESDRHITFSIDLENYGKVAESLQNILKNTGPIEIVVNNSGGPPAGQLMTADLNDFEKGFHAHVMASQSIMHTLLPGMKEKQYGRFINIISTSVKIPIQNLGVSNTIRAAMANWSKTLASEVGPFGVTVNNILPGYTKTPRLASLLAATAKRENKAPEEIEKGWLAAIPARRFGEPRDIAEAALFLASPRASYINGTQLVVDGGRTGSL